MSMDRLWAPWRLAYIQPSDEPDSRQLDPPAIPADADASCFLCQAIHDSADRHRLVVHRGEGAITVLNKYPYNNGHLLIAPLSHVGRLDEIDRQTHADLAEELTRMVDLLERAIRPEGFNIGLNLGRVAGAGLPGHLHWHIVPRWSGDTNFMPSVAGTKVIPQSLDALWEVLQEA